MKEQPVVKIHINPTYYEHDISFYEDMLNEGEKVQVTESESFSDINFTGRWKIVNNKGVAELFVEVSCSVTKFTEVFEGIYEEKEEGLFSKKLVKHRTGYKVYNTTEKIQNHTTFVKDSKIDLVIEWPIQECNNK